MNVSIWCITNNLCYSIITIVNPNKSLHYHTDNDEKTLIAKWNTAVREKFKQIQEIVNIINNYQGKQKSS